MLHEGEAGFGLKTSSIENICMLFELVWEEDKGKFVFSRCSEGIIILLSEWLMVRVVGALYAGEDVDSHYMYI